MRGFKRVHGTLFSLSYGMIPERMCAGAACIVSAKIAPRATMRNKIKRRCRAALVPLMQGARSPIVLVFSAKKSASDATFVEVRAEVASLAQKAGIPA